MQKSDIVTITMIAATLPFIACIFVGLNNYTKVSNLDDYFIFSRRLDLDSFLKSTVGYSLQVAAIALFLTWTFSYGLWGLIVCVAWSLGYIAVGLLIRSGALDGFIKSSGDTEETSLRPVATIHGFVGERVGPTKFKKYAVWMLALASVIGISGTMLTEIYYGSGFFLEAVGIPDASLVLSTTVHLTILFFTSIYVLWGGFKASVYIDRFQTPIAYLAFGLFCIGVAASSKGTGNDTSSAAIVVVLAIIFAIILFNRYRLMGREQVVSDETASNRLISSMTFMPLIAAAILVLLYLIPYQGGWVPLLAKSASHGDDMLGFGISGAVSLGVANAVWQLIDISSLQRLQAIDIVEVQQNRSVVVSTYITVGIEAGLGWGVLIGGALLLFVNGYTISESNSTTIVKSLLERQGFAGLLLPALIFAMVVFMISTVSCFISALSYISFHDVMSNSQQTVAGDTAAGALDRARLSRARVTTIVAVIILYAMYVMFNAEMKKDEIGPALYAIYAFQLAITPSVLAALFLTRYLVSGPGAILSTFTGMVTAWFTATHDVPSWLAWFADTNSWYVIPPFAVIVVSTVTYTVIAAAFGGITKAFENRRA